MSFEVSVQASEPRVSIYVYAVRGPLRTNAAAYDTWSKDVVNQIYQRGSVTEALNYRLETDYISQPVPALNSNTVWFVVQVVGDTIAEMFSPSRLEFVGRSSDPANSLGKTNRFDDPSYVYAPQVLGVRWGEGGPRASDTLLTSGHWNTEMVNELIFPGAASKYYVYANSAQRANIDTYVNGFSNYRLTGTWRFLDVSGTPIAYASKTLETTGNPRRPLLSIARSGSGVEVGMSLDSGQTAILQSTRSLSPPISWMNEGTMNEGERIAFPGFDTKFFRAVLE
jgi:hypothetical protein